MGRRREMSRIKENCDVRENCKQYVANSDNEKLFTICLLLADISKSLAIIADRLDSKESEE